jgi:hypothetical protein
MFKIYRKENIGKELVIKFLPNINNLNESIDLMDKDGYTIYASHALINGEYNKLIIPNKIYKFIKIILSGSYGYVMKKSVNNISYHIADTTEEDINIKSVKEDYGENYEYEYINLPIMNIFSPIYADGEEVKINNFSFKFTVNKVCHGETEFYNIGKILPVIDERNILLKDLSDESKKEYKKFLQSKGDIKGSIESYLKSIDRENVIKELI